MKKITSILLLLFLISNTTGCTSHTPINKQEEVLPEKIILHDPVWGDITIDEQSDIQRIEKLRNQMEETNQTPDDFQGKKVPAEWVYPSGIKQDAIFSALFLKIGHDMYAGDTAQNIMEMIESYKYRSDRLQHLLSDSKEVNVYARDLDSTPVTLNSAQIAQLKDGFRDARRFSEDIDILIMSNSQFPNYELVLRTKNHKEIRIRILNETFFIVDVPGETYIHFRDSGLLYNTVKGLYPVPKITDDSLLYLFQAKKVIMKQKHREEEHDLSVIRNRIVRSLIYEEEAENLGNEDYPVQLIFYFADGKQIKVAVYEHHLMFNNKRIDNQGVGAAFYSMLRTN
ncbi:MAG: DUF3919 family protein [Bacillaceae bacterium]|nr:DUF3919 family protein [Bacillaceae bacterium]